MKLDNKKTYIAPQTEVVAAQPCTPLASSGEGDQTSIVGGKKGSFFDEYVGDSESTSADATDKWENLSGWGE